MSNLVIVSADGHAAMPEDAWPEYVERRYHEFLPKAHEEGQRFLEFQRALISFTPETLSVMDPDEVLGSGGWQGIWDLDRRLAEMDREGIAAEFVIPGDQRAPHLFSQFYGPCPAELIKAGKDAYHRWAADTFGPAKDRLLILGDAAAVGDMADMLADLEWLADHGFAATSIPGRVVRPDLPPLHDEYFDPFWAKCADLGLPILMHAGFGSEVNEYGKKYEKVIKNMEAAGRTNLLEEFLHHAKDFFELSLRPRQAMWQMMLGGVFDRHPRLRLLMTELRADWLPATLRHLDAAYLRSRADVPAKKLPSEYWKTNCLAGVSFMHKAEAETRYEIGVETIAFGRDYPHAEGTWPNTREWLSDLFAGVSENEVRLMLGENLIRVLGLDRAHLESVAARIGPGIDQVTKPTTTLDPRLAEIFHSRGGYLKPVEQVDADAIDALLRQDFALSADDQSTAR